MPITNGYATLAELKRRLDIDTDYTAVDADLERVIEASSRAIDDYTGRRFYVAAEPSQRRYSAASHETLRIDDLSTADSVVVELGDGAGNWAAVDASSYQLEPVNAPEVGLPYTRIRGLSTRWPVSNAALVRITGRWGYASELPAVVTEACLLQASRLFQRKDAPFGIAGAATEMGSMRLLARLDADVEVLLNSVRRTRPRGLRSVQLRKW